MPPTGCFYEAELGGWSQVETNNGESLEQRVSPGVAMEVETISVCRNGSAAFFHGVNDETKFAVRFVRANQDAFQALLQRRNTLESEVSFRTEAAPPVIRFSEEGQVTVQWQERTATIVGERELYVPTKL